MSDFHPLVSIVIPVYNGSNYMREAINSALAQTYDNCEVLVINDGSTDNGETERIALSYGNKIRYFSKTNGGVATALNLGIREMRGEYFSWLSHDDVYLPEKVEAQVAALSGLKNKESVIFCDITYINAKGEKLYSLRVPPEITKSPFCFLFERGGVHGCALLIPRATLLAAGLFPEKFPTTQDYELWFTLGRMLPFAPCEGCYVLSRNHEEQGSVTIAHHHDEIIDLHKRNVENYFLCKGRELGSEEKALRYLLQQWIDLKKWSFIQNVFFTAPQMKNKWTSVKFHILYVVGALRKLSPDLRTNFGHIKHIGKYICRTIWN